MKNAGAGLVAASMIAIVPGYISRSVAGSYDNEGISFLDLSIEYFNFRGTNLHDRATICYKLRHQFTYLSHFLQFQIKDIIFVCRYRDILHVVDLLPVDQGY